VRNEGSRVAASSGERAVPRRPWSLSKAFFAVSFFPCSTGVQAELILRSVRETSPGVAASRAHDAQYLQERLVFSEGRILDHEQGAVMMHWEKALMEAHAQVG